MLDPASLLVNRKAKQHKTDRIDAKKMVRALLAHDRGDAAVLSRVRVPSVEEEDRKRLHRERQRLVTGADIADELDQGTSQVARHLRRAASFEGLRGEVRRRGDRVRVTAPAAGPAGDPADCGNGWHSWKSRSPGSRPNVMRSCCLERRSRWWMRPREAQARAAAKIAALTRLKAIGPNDANHPDARSLLPRVPQSLRTRELGRCDANPLGERKHATRPGDQPRRSSMDPGTAHPNGVALAALSA